MWDIKIEAEKCEGEGDCVNVCPVAILSLDESGPKKVAFLSGSAEDCIGCMACQNDCPSGALTVNEE